VVSTPHKPDGSEASETGSPDLTSTIHLSALRSVRNQRNIEEIFSLLSSEERAVLADLPKESSMFIVVAGPNMGERFLLNSESTTIGRDPSSAIFLDDVTVSRKHAEIVRRDGGFFVEDRGSLNGSYVNSRPVTNERLVVGDEVQIGKFRLTYFSGKGNS
jgi:pSer/pThr/pTyr-binding forkhead associated (FHA) protein